jgi:hypothetical protein
MGRRVRVFFSTINHPPLTISLLLNYRRQQKRRPRAVEGPGVAGGSDAIERAANSSSGLS